MASKRKAAAMGAAPEEPVDPSDELMFLCLGGGNEVGRSCHIIQYKGKTVMLDAGQHPAYDGLASLPFFDDFDLSTVDVLLISHFHIDHAASLPYVLAKTNFRGRVFMTHPTKAIYKWLIQDSVRVGNTSSNPTTQLVYTEQDHLSTFRQIEAIDYHTTHTVSGIRITPYPAGHVLGAAMFLVEIAGLKIFFTGDYSRELDRHLVSAEVPKGVKIDVLITESTYGIASHVPRLEREQALMKSITGILNRGGRVLMPVFALGRAQELLLILDEYWSKHPDFQNFPIYYASNLAKKCMVVYQTYTGAMNDNIKRLYAERAREAEASGNTAGVGGPWDFRFIRSLKSLDRFEDIGGCVMLASPGMLQNGVSRELLERWAPSDKNGVIITGYSVEGTMAKQIMQEPEHIQAVMSRSLTGGNRRAPGADSEKVLIPRRCSVQEYSFAAHVDGTENREFIEEVNAPVVILVHGEQHNMMRLKSKLLSLNSGKAEKDKMKVFSPRNCEELRIPFKTDKIAKVVGKLATVTPPTQISQQQQQQDADQDRSSGPIITGVLVQNDFKLSFMAPEDLHEYAGLTTTTIVCRQRLTLSAAGIDLIRWALEGTFGAIEELPEMHKQKNSLKQPQNGIAAKKIGANGNGNGALPESESEPAQKNGDGEDEDMEDDKLYDEEEEEEDNGEEEEEEEEEEADEEINKLVAAYLVMGCVSVRYFANGEIELEWEGNLLNDGIADAVMAVLFSVESSPAAVKQSGKNGHSHSHGDHDHDHGQHVLPVRNLHAHITPEEQFSRLCMFLEAQFGADNVSPIAEPRLPEEEEGGEGAKQLTGGTESDDANGENNTTAVDEKRQERARRELERLHAAGIAVPGVLVKVDKMEAKVWLDDLEIECAQRVFADRVRAVVERAVEVTAPLWR